MNAQQIMSSASMVFSVNDIIEIEKKKPRGSASLASLLSAFVPTWSTAFIFIVIFAAIRHRYPKIYAPRTFIGTIPEKDRTPGASRSYFDFIHTLRRVPDKFLLYHGSLDTYLYLRFLRTLIFICVVGCCITWPILMPINASGGGKSSQLDMITIGNVADKKKLYAHALIAWIFFTFVMFTVARERLWLIGLRQAWNLSKSNSNRLSSRTVLFLSAPKEALNEQNLQRNFGDEAVRLWPATHAEKLAGMVSDRNSKVEQLESAEMSFIQAVNSKGRQGAGRTGSTPRYASLPDTLKKSLRPTQRLKTKPVGKQVDSIDYLREQIKEKESSIEKARESYDTGAHASAAVFVEYQSLAAAQKAYQQVTSSELLALHPRFTGVSPGEVIWTNLTIAPARRISQEGIAIALVVATIIFWFIPVALVGAISNVSYLADNYKWLSFLNRLPDVLMGLLTGLVPPLLTSLLSKYVPNIFRYIFKTFGEPTNTSAELKVLKWFYVFQVIHVFLVTAIASGSAAAIPQLSREAAENPLSVPLILAKNLPTSSNFYLNYFIVQGLTSSSDNLLNYSDLLSYLFFDYFFDKTPRQKYKSFTSMRGISWGKVFPKYTNFVIIAIAYSCIAPLVLGFAAAGLTMFYFSYRYQLLFTVQPKIDTKGHCYTLALQQILTGIYIAELSLIGLFGLRSATGPAIMMSLLLILTIIYNTIMNRYFTPLENFIPANLATESESETSSEDGSGSEQTPLLSSAEEGRALQQQSEDTHIHRIGTKAHIPSKFLDPLARFLQPQIFASHKAMRAWLEEGDFDDDVQEYKDEEVESAYLNPAFTSKTPVVWLARDGMGVSVEEVRECESGGLRATDRGAWVDEKGVVRWCSDDFAEVPVFKEGVKW